MGLYDTVYVDPSVAKVFNVDGSKLHGPYLEFQTKDFHCVMEEYVLKFAMDGEARLFLVDPPDANKFVLYTDEEIQENNDSLDPENWLTPMFTLKKGTGYFPEEALAIENRNHRSMGELPHQHLTMRDYDHKTEKFTEYDLKFTDGVLERLVLKSEL